MNDNYSNKSHFLTGLLCLLLGRTGAHRFYVGKYISGSIYLLIFLVPLLINKIGFSVVWYISLASLFLSIVDLLMICYNMFEDNKKKILHPDHSRLSPDSAATWLFVAGVYYFIMSLIKESLFNLILSLICMVIGFVYAYKYLKS